jgi:hypothetical protein
MKIQILGMGCPKCNALEKNARDAAAELGLAADFEKVNNRTRSEMGVMRLPPWRRTTLRASENSCPRIRSSRCSRAAIIWPKKTLPVLGPPSRPRSPGGLLHTLRRSGSAVASRILPQLTTTPGSDLILCLVPAMFIPGRSPYSSTCRQ